MCMHIRKNRCIYYIFPYVCMVYVKELRILAP